MTNRCFPSKTIALWHQLDDRGHMRLVERYLREAGNFDTIRKLDRNPRRLLSDPLYAVVGRSTGPFAGGDKRTWPDECERLCLDPMLTVGTWKCVSEELCDPV